MEQSLDEAAEDEENKIRGTDVLARVGAAILGAPPLVEVADQSDVAKSTEVMAIIPVGRPGKGRLAKANLNSNTARSKFGVYEIRVDGELFKIGKADLNRVTRRTGLPTRLHQQLRKLEKAYGKNRVTGHVVEELGKVTTAQAKAAETARLRALYNETGKVPKGNQKSFKP
ncbi:MAG: hypothetical protein IPG45_03215 [Deltaproteobacteria bacterium]|nr:hypothetical protein [Deltaproteobacteria bacterium]